jgi:hypothetical protein
MKNVSNNHKQLVAGGAMVLAITTSVFAQEKPFSLPGTGQPPSTPPVAKAAAATPAAEAGPIEKLFNGKIPDAFAKGKFNFNARMRYEYVDQTGVAAITDPSHAITLRSRFGFTTAPVYGFQGMIEGEDVRAIGPDGNYNAAGSNGKAYKPVVADPETTELNQAWLSYSYTNMFTIKGGRQRIALDNHRFIGDVGWRQNMQTYDAAQAEFKPIQDLNIYYGYVWDVHRPFGDVGGLPAASTDFSSRSHLINISYSPFQYGRFVGYAYLLDLKNAGGANASSATYGGYFAGNAPVNDTVTLDYRAELATQSDYADSTLSYDALYYNLELGASIKPFAFGAGYESLGSDNGTAFRTPLATLHAFNGWADVFLTTPNAGLRDLYGYAQVTLPAQIPVRFVYHKYDSDAGSLDFGNEFDVVVSKKFGKNWTAMLKYAYYLGDNAATPSLAVANVDVQKFWAQVEFNF